MRNFYKRVSLRKELTQGSIINNCLADNYESDNILGLIITPRCDLDHGIKVKTIHYLPVIPIAIWLEFDGMSVLTKDVVAQVKGIINNAIFQKHKVKRYLDTFMATKENVIDLLKDNKKLDITYIELYFNPTRINIETFLKENRKLKSSLFEKLEKDELSPYYLVEGWDDTSSHYVINLREIHQISRFSAQIIKQGIFATEVNDMFYQDSSLRKTTDPNATYEIIREINSPFIEHILQRYVYHFSRIGVEDREKTDWTDYL